MANWIEFHIALRDHWKIDRLSTALSCDYATALGYIACLWCWAAVNAPTGNLKRFNDVELCKASRLKSQKGYAIALKEILKRVELVDANDQIHDWCKHGIKLLESTRNRVKEYRERLRNSNVTVTPTLPTLPNHTLPTNKDIVNFDDFWKAYPKKAGKAYALKCWERLKINNGLKEKIMVAVEKQKKWPQWIKDNGQYIPNPSTWLNQGRWDDEYTDRTCPKCKDKGKYISATGYEQVCTCPAAKGKS